MTKPAHRDTRSWLGKTLPIAGLLTTAILMLAACATQAPSTSQAQTQTEATVTSPPTAAALRQPVTILVSIDGFRDDYIRRGLSPTLWQLAARGVTGLMHPAFPSKTFPNHWTLVTGLRPDRHGIVGNHMESPERKEPFTMATDDPWWWSAAAPIWVDAEKAGMRTATMFWPGSNVAIGGTAGQGTRPSDWAPFDHAVSDTQRVNKVLDWLRRPEATRPVFVTLYFDEVDAAGHAHGPDSVEVNQAVARVDDAMGLLVAGLKALGQPANLVIVSDHGMAATSSERTIALDKLVDPRLYHVVEAGTYASLAPQPGRTEEVERALLVPHEHMQCWRKADIPARLHYSANPRIPPIVCLAQVGWLVLASAPPKSGTGGDHGYDNMAPEMNALFIATGPAFAAGQVLPDFDNVDVYPLLRRLLGLPVASRIDGSDAVFRDAFRAPSPAR